MREWKPSSRTVRRTLVVIGCLVCGWLLMGKPGRTGPPSPSGTIARDTLATGARTGVDAGGNVLISTLGQPAASVSDSANGSRVYHGVGRPRVSHSRAGQWRDYQ